MLQHDLALANFDFERGVPFVCDVNPVTVGHFVPPMLGIPTDTLSRLGDCVFKPTNLTVYISGSHAHPPKPQT